MSLPCVASSLTVDEFRRLEAIPKRAIMIISGANDYDFYCSWYKLEQLNTRLNILTRNCYTKILQQSDMLTQTAATTGTGVCSETPNF